MADSWNVVLSVDSTGAVKGFREFDRSAKTAEKSAQKLGTRTETTTNKMNAMRASVRRLNSALKTIGFGGFSIALIAATRSALDFDKAMAEVSTLINEAYDPTNVLADEVRRLSKEFAQSPTTQAKALYQVISAGAGDAGEAVKTLTAANKLAVGGVTDVATAADGLTSVINAYGLSAESASRISDVMFEAMKAGKTTIGELSGAVGLLAPIAAQTGVSFEEMFAATAALTKGGLSTSMAMTGLRQALVNVLKPMKTSADTAAELGIEFNATAIKSMGLAKFMGQLIEKAEGNTDALVNLFGSVEGLNAMMALTAEQGAADFIEILDQMHGGIERLIRESGAATAEGVMPLKEAMQALISPTEDALQAALDLGVAFNAGAVESKGLTQFMAELNEKINGNEEIIVKLFGSMERYNALMNQVGRDGGKAVISMFRELRTGMSATDEAVKKVTDSIDFQLSQLKSNITDAFLGMGQSILAGMAPIIETLNNNFETVVRTVVTGTAIIAGALTGKLLVALASVETGFFAMVKATYAQNVAFLTITGSATTVRAALLTLTATIKGMTAALLTNPVAWAAVIAGMAAWILMGKDTEEQADELIRKIDDLIERFDTLSEIGQKEAVRITSEGLPELQEALADLDSQIRVIQNQGLHTLFGTFPVESQEAQDELVKLQAQFEQFENRVLLAQEALFKMTNSTFDSVVKYAEAQIELRGLTGAYTEWKEQQEAATKASEDAEVTQARRIIQLQEEQETIQGLTKQEQRRYETLKNIVDAEGQIRAQYVKDQQIISIAYRLSGKSAAEEAAAIAKLTEKRDADLESLKKTGKTVEDVNKATETYKKTLDSLYKRVNKSLPDQAQFSLELAKMAREGLAAGKSVEEIQKEIKKLQDAYKKDKTKDMLDRLERYKIGNDEVKLAIYEHEKALEELIKDQTFQLLSKDDQKAYLEMLREEHEKNVEAINKHKNAADELVEAQGAAAQRLHTIWKQGLKNIQNSFADAFKDILDGGKNVFDGIVDAFKDMISQMLATWFSSGIMNILTGQAWGAGGNSLLNLFSAVTGSAPQGTAGAGSTGSVGAMAGFTSAVSSLAFTAATLWEGAKTFLLQGTGSLQIGSVNATAGIGGALAGAGLGAISGGLANKVFGERGKNNTAWSAVGGAIGSIFGPLGALAGGAIGSFVSNLIGGAKALESAFLEVQLAAGNFSGEIETITSKQKSFFRGKRYYTNTEDVPLSEVQEMFEKFRDGLKTTAQALGIEFGNFFETFSTSTKINIKGLSQEEAQEKLESAIKGIFKRMMSALINEAEGMSERFERTIRTFKNNTDEFLSAFEMLAALDLASQLLPSERAAELLVEQNTKLIETYRQVLTEYNKVVEAYDGTIESLANITQATLILTDIQTQLALAYEAVGEEATAMFQTTAQQIREALMNEEELYNLREQQVDDLVEQLSRATDPSEIASLSEQINRLTLDAFNMLDENQQQIMGEDFLAFLDEVTSLTQGVVSSNQSQLDDDARASDALLTQTLLEAAARQEAAAFSFYDGVRVFRGVIDTLFDRVYGVRPYYQIASSLEQINEP